MAKNSGLAETIRALTPVAIVGGLAWLAYRSGLFNAVTSGVKDVAQGTGEAVQGLGGGISNAAQGLGYGLAASGVAVGNTALDIAALAREITGEASENLNAIGNATENAITTIGNTANDVLGFPSRAATAIWNSPVVSALRFSPLSIITAANRGRSSQSVNTVVSMPADLGISRGRSSAAPSTLPVSVQSAVNRSPNRSGGSSSSRTTVNVASSPLMSRASPLQLLRLRGR